MPAAARWTAPPGTTSLIFDCDGTLADTMPLHYRAWTALFARLGVPFPAERFYALGGVPTERIIRLVAADHALALPADIGDLVAVKEAEFLRHLPEVRPVPAALALAEAYRGRLPIAVASGGYRDVVRRTLAAIGVGWVEVVVCAEDTGRHKPDPDVFLEAARRLGVAPAGCVVIEDTAIGLEAARRACMTGVDVRALG